MNTLKDIMTYIITNYPNNEELSKARLTKIVYLSDWVNAVNHNQQLTEIRWYYDHYGPFVDDIINTAKMDNDFDIISSSTVFGEPKSIIQLNSDGFSFDLSNEAKKSIDFVINKTKSLSWSKFIKLVYSTYPIVVSKRYTFLNLVNLAQMYKSLNASAVN